MDTLDNFSSSDDLHFLTSDYGTLIQRRLVLDHDGNIRECVSEILDPTVEGGYDEGRMEALARVATMNQVVEILQKSG
ncbi:hypothetical protein JHK85_009286 [Glycine max]|nr:hypothetical protein JHK85_009286 [Glycine max]